MSPSEPERVVQNQDANSGWKSLYKLGGTTVLLAALIPLLEIGISFLPGVDRMSRATVTAVDWFTLFQNHWFLGLRNLGLLNVIGASLLTPTILAIYAALRRDNEAFAAAGAVLFYVGLAVYLAGNRGFVMLSLSRQYASASTDAQRSLLIAAGQAVLAGGQNRSGILILEFAFVVISATMLGSRVFSKVTAHAGIVGYALLMVVEIAFVPAMPVGGMVLGAVAGLSIMTWYVKVGRTLLRLGRT